LNHFEGSTHVFIIRIWHEPREEGYVKPVWRGMVENLATQERRYFQSLARLMEFISEMGGLGSDD
jgi:hypothetical protein